MGSLTRLFLFVTLRIIVSGSVLCGILVNSGGIIGEVHFSARYAEKGDKCLLVIGLGREQMVARDPSVKCFAGKRFWKKREPGNVVIHSMSRLAEE